ncbi:MAG: ABC transporter permease subunit [Enterocloster clostridioformis]
MGIIAGAKKGKAADRIISSYALVTASTPAFWVALVLLVVFAVWLKLLPYRTFRSNRGGGVGCDHEGPPDSWHTAWGCIGHYRHLQHCPPHKGEAGRGHGK